MLASTVKPYVALTLLSDIYSTTARYFIMIGINFDHKYSGMTVAVCQSRKDATKSVCHIRYVAVICMGHTRDTLIT